MIDWQASNATINKVTTSSFVHNQLIELICVGCGVKKTCKYRRSRHHNIEWRCLKCAMRQASEQGLIKSNPGNLPSGKELSELAKKRWADPIYREKIISKRKAKPRKVYSKVCGLCDKKYKVSRRQAKSTTPCMSCTMRLRWNNDEYRKMIAHLTAEYTKKLWESDEYRTKITIANQLIWGNRTKELSDRAYALWRNESYRDSVLAGMATPEAKQKLALSIAKQSGQRSKLQTTLYDFLDDLKIGYYKESVETIIGHYVFDCLINRVNNKHLLIECQGDYWHSRPQTIKNGKSKFTYIDRYFPEYEIMYIWEHEFYVKDRVLDRLKLKLGLNIETIDFNFKDVQIRQPNAKEIKSFLDAYHYIGKGRGGRVIGAYFNNILIACAVYGLPVRHNTINSTATELIRFCIHPSYHKRNFASWFLTKSLSIADNNLVVAYADTTIGHTGSIYKACGFQLDHIVPSDYWYVDSDGFVMHKKTLYNRAIKSHLTERTFAEQHGYIKKYGGHKLCFIKRL